MISTADLYIWTSEQALHWLGLEADPIARADHRDRVRACVAELRRAT